MIELEFQPRGLFRTRIEVNVGGVPLTNIERSAFGGNGHFELDGVRYEVQRGFFRRDAHLLREGHIRARAGRRSFFSRSLEVDCGERTYELVRPFLSATAELRFQGRVVGRSRRTGWFRATRSFECPEVVEPAVAVFLGWLLVSLEEKRTSAPT